jgi:CBS domain-containing protein
MSAPTILDLDEHHVRDVARGVVIAAHAPSTPPALAALLVVNRIHGVLITAHGHPRWMSDLDVLTAAVGGVGGWFVPRSREVPTIDPDASLRAAARVMTAAGATHALVRDGDAYTGVVSALDLCAAVAGLALAGEPPPSSSALSIEEHRLERVPASRVMHHGVISTGPSTPLVVLARTMSQVPTHSVVVDGLRHDAGGEHLVWGVVTDLDLVRALGDGREDAVAADVAVTEALCIDAADPLDDVARQLCMRGVTHAIVTDAAGRPCGVVSTWDVLRVLACATGI